MRLNNNCWKATDTYYTDWETLAFNDDNWAQAHQNYPAPDPPNELIPGTNAKAIWYYPIGTPNGINGPNEAFFRYDFNLDLTSGSIPLIGQALVNVDDDYEFYVNGQLAYENKDGGGAQIVDFVDYTSKLRNGPNAFAIHAVDGEWGNPYDRLYERFIFDGVIRTVGTATVPEPASTTLFCLGGLLASAMGIRKFRTHP